MGVAERGRSFNLHSLFVIFGENFLSYEKVSQNANELSNDEANSEKISGVTEKITYLAYISKFSSVQSKSLVK